jgi:amidase
VTARADRARSTGRPRARPGAHDAALSTTAPATDLLDLLASRAVSAQELLELHLERVDALDHTLGSIVAIDRELARRQAQEADRRRQQARSTGEDVPALLGLPITVKDSFAVAGLPTACGLAAAAPRPPEPSDAPAVARLRAAGAIPFAKTNVPAFLADLQTSNEAFGTTANPYDLRRSPGGSSGGAAAAVAAGLSALELGSDLSGSIRIPASWCGLWGHCPSYGLVSKLGHLPWPLDGLLEPDSSVVGPLARSADDLELALDILARDPRTGPGAAPHALGSPPELDRSLADYTIGLWTHDPLLPCDPEVAAALGRAVDALSDAGAHLVELDPRPVELSACLELFASLVEGEIARGLGPAEIAEELRIASGATGASATRRRRASLRTQLHASWLAAAEQREQVRAAWARLFKSVDAVLCPAAPVVAIEHDHSPMDERTIAVGDERRPYDELSGWSSLASVGRLPATVVPIGVGAHSALPVGAQVIGPYLGDYTTIAVGRLVGQLTGGYRPPDLPR